MEQHNKVMSMVTALAIVGQLHGSSVQLAVVNGVENAKKVVSGAKAKKSYAVKDLQVLAGNKVIQHKIPYSILPQEVQELLGVIVNPNKAMADFAEEGSQSLWQMIQRVDMPDPCVAEEGSAGNWSPIVRAVIQNNLFGVEAFLIWGVDPHKRYRMTAQNKKTLFHYAIDKQNPKLITLLAQYADVNKPDMFGDTLLSKACLSENVGVVQACLDGGANIEQVDERGNTALLVAVSGEQSDIVQLLLQRRAKIDCRNLRGETVFDRARNDAIRGLLEQAAVEQGYQVPVKS